MKDLVHYAALAELFRYPSENLRKFADEWKSIVMKYDPDLARYLYPFLDHIENNTPEYLEEYFVGTFYVHPLCCLDIGYVLFGEDYRRGQFMANLAMEHRIAANDCGTELPDHLPVLLTLIPKLQNADFTDELVISLLIPAIDEMIACFRKDDNHYKGLLRILKKIMDIDFPESKYERFRFGKSSGQEDTTVERHE